MVGVEGFRVEVEVWVVGVEGLRVEVEWFRVELEECRVEVVVEGWSVEVEGLESRGRGVDRCCTRIDVSCCQAYTKAGVKSTKTETFKCNNVLLSVLQSVML